MPKPFLPLATTQGPHGSRSWMTCTFRCGNACFHPAPNRSGNEHIRDVLRQAITRRSILGGTAAGSAALVLGLSNPAAAGTGAAAERSSVGSLTFDPVEPNTRDNVTVPVGYDYDLLVGWGDPVERGAPPFDVYDQSPSAQAKQFGYNCDYVSVQPIPGKPDRFALVVNHEYTDEHLMFPTGVYTGNQIRRIAMMAMGMSVVEIERGVRDGSYRRVPVSRSTLNRRLTVSTPFEVTGPAAGAARLKTTADPTGTRVLGTLNNCAGGYTPWGTVLSGEENFDDYFEASNGLDPTYAESYERYGIVEEQDLPRQWYRVDPRFDLSQEPHEPFRFGWVVEVDPLDPESTPKKRTMLGRFKHEGATVVLSADGRIVVYSGDDERGDYMYRFVSRLKYKAGGTAADRRHNMRLLDHGTLSVARLRDEAHDPAPEYDGVGRWIPLCSDEESYVDGFSVVDVLIDTRLAADTVGPTRMDRPEDIGVGPTNGRVYVALTNNDDRGTEYPADEANPLESSLIREEFGGPLIAAAGNNNGYVLEFTPRGDDHGTDRFDWVLMLVCGDPDAPETYFAGYPKDQVSPISCPDNLAFDGRGNLWIATDGNALGSNDGLFAVPTEGSERGNVMQFLTMPVGAETCGPLISRDGRTVFTAVQHPGEVDGATFEDPASTWPHTTRYPIPSVIVTYRVDGQRIGR